MASANQVFLNTPQITKTSTTFAKFAGKLTSWIMLKTSLIASGMIPGEYWSPCKYHY